MRILRVLRGYHLKCGCSVGVYETFSGHIIDIVDVKADGCTDGQHRVGQTVDNPDSAGEQDDERETRSAA